MKFTCDQCQRVYSIPDERVRGKTVRVRCKNCQHMLTVTWSEQAAESKAPEPTRAVSLHEMMTIQGNPEARGAWESEPTRALPGPDPAIPWFMLVGGMQQGPMNVDQLKGAIHRGEITLRTYVWRQGQPEWKRCSDVAELIPLFAGAPHAPPASKDATPGSSRRKILPRRPEAGAERKEPAPSGGLSSSALFSDVKPTPDPSDGLEDSLAADLEAPRSGSGKHASVLAPALDDEPPTEEAPAPSDGDADSPRDPDEETVEASADPFEALRNANPGSEEEPEIGEATAFFIAQAGVNRRNPPWKIALTLFLFLAVPTGILWLLSSLHVVPLQVRHMDSQGHEVSQSVFSAGGVSGLKDLLLGRNQVEHASSSPPPPPRRGGSRAQSQVASALNGARSGTGPDTKTGPSATGSVSGVDARDLHGGGIAGTYDASGKLDVRPQTLRGSSSGDAEEASGGGPPPEELKKVVDQTQPAFQFCIEQYVRKHPAFHGGKVSLVATVGGSGIVKKTVLDRPDIDTSELGGCIKARAKRMVFASFRGDDVDLQIPLILTTSL